MKINDLSIIEKSHYYNDSDIFNRRPPKTPERYKFKNDFPSILEKTSNFPEKSSDYLTNVTKNKDRYSNNKKDHVNDCLRSKTPIPYFRNKYKNYRRTQELKKESKRMQLDKSYDYDFNDNNNIYKSIALHSHKGNIFLGNDPTNFSSEYNRMHDYAKQIMLRKRINKEKKISDELNKSVDIPHRFQPIHRKNYNRKHAIKDLFIKNTGDYDLNKSTDNININYYKSNIFFDREKEKANETLDKIVNENRTKKQKQKLKIKERENQKYNNPNNIIQRRRNLLEEDLNALKPRNAEEQKKFIRDGNFPPKYANYQPLKEIKLKSIDDLYNAKNKRLYAGITEMERNTDKYVVLDISKNEKFDEGEIKKLFSRNGIHMFGEQVFSSYIENGKKGKFVFNIRKDLNDKDYNDKLKKIQNILMKKQGIVMNLDDRKVNYNKKRRKDIRPVLNCYQGPKNNNSNKRAITGAS